MFSMPLSRKRPTRMPCLPRLICSTSISSRALRMRSSYSACAACWATRRCSLSVFPIASRPASIRVASAIIFFTLAVSGRKIFSFAITAPTFFLHFTTVKYVYILYTIILSREMPHLHCLFDWLLTMCVHPYGGCFLFLVRIERADQNKK